MSDNAIYLKARKKEGRLYSDNVVKNLPNVPIDHPLQMEWRARATSAKRLTRYLSQKTHPLKILDLGCGNGWLSNQLCKADHEVLGVDQNLFELKQAARVFLSSPKPHFLEADIFSAPFPKKSFDIFLLASSVQYFPDLTRLIKTLFDYLKPNGEVHILDSAFYSDAQIKDAIHRSEEYYSALGFPEMSKFYFHHRVADLDNFSVKWLYRPNSFLLRIKSLFGKVDSPFPWIVIPK